MAEKKYSVLIVDDSAAMRRIIRELLGRLNIKGPTIQEAETLSQAFERMQADQFDVVLCDIDLGRKEEDGLELLRAVRNSTDTVIRATPFIMVTKDNTQRSVMTARQFGIDGYLLKPFHATTLKEKLKLVKTFKDL